MFHLNIKSIENQLKFRGIDISQDINYYPEIGANAENMDDETGLYYYGARYYDPKISVFIGVDPKADKAPNESPYVYCSNNPIVFVDPDGNFKLPADQQQKYQRLTNYLKNNIQDIKNNPTIVNSLKKYGEFTDKQIEKGLEWGKGPTINVTKLKDGVAGEFTPDKKSTELRLSDKVVDLLEGAKGEDRDAMTVFVGVTLLHEFTHYGDDQDGKDIPGEEGAMFEKQAYGKVINSVNDVKKILNSYNEKHGIEKRYKVDEE